jgi:hypothetical protein
MWIGRRTADQGAASAAYLAGASDGYLFENAAPTACRTSMCSPRRLSTSTGWDVASADTVINHFNGKRCLVNKIVLAACPGHCVVAGGEPIRG